MRARRLAIGAAAIAVVLGLGMELLPGLAVRPILVSRLSAAVGTPVHLGWISWNPFSGAWTVRGVQVDADRGPPAIRVRRIIARLWLIDLVRRRWLVRDLRLVGARARLRPSGPVWALPLPPRERAVTTSSPEFALEGGHARPLTVRFEGREKTLSFLHLRRVELAAAIVAPGTIRATGSLRGRLDRGRIVLAASFRRTGTSDRLRARAVAAGLDMRRTLRLAPSSFGALDVGGLLDLRARYEQLVHHGHDHRKIGGRGGVRELAIGAHGARGMHARAITLDRFDADLAAHTIVLGQATLDGAEAWIDRQDAGVGIAGLLDPRAAPAAAPPAWRLGWRGVELTGGAVHYVDSRTEERGIDVEVARGHVDPSTGGDAEVPVSFTGRLASGGNLSLSGAVRREPFGLRADVSFDEVALPPVAPLVNAPVPLESGRTTGQVSVELGPDVLSASGSVTVEDLKTRSPTDAVPEDIVAFKTLRARLRTFRSEPFAAELDSVALEWPYVLIDRRADGIFPLTVFGGTAPEAAGVPPAVTLSALTVHGGRIDFRDTTLTPPYWRSLANLDGTAEAVRLPPVRVATLRATGMIDELSPVRVEGSIGARAHLRADVERVALPPFNPYLTPVSDYLVSSGALTAHSEITLDRSQLEVTNRVVLSRLGLGGGGDDAVQRELGIPLTLAIALMKDYRGDIALDLPFTGDLASPHFSLRSVIFQAALHALRGAILAPLRALGQVIVREGRIEHFNVDPVTFAPGARDLDAAGRERVTQIARLLGLHPELAVTVSGQVAAADVDRLQEDKALAALGPDRDADRLRATLEARRRGAPEPSLTSGERARLGTVVASMPWPAEELRQLAEDRAAAVTAALLLTPGIDAKRVTAAPAAAPLPGALGALPAATLDLRET